MWTKWLPWRFVVSRLARSQGFLDPVALLSRLHRFAQPSEVAEPIELLRAGVVFHARGLINARAIQHNLDWVWPFWVERQFDPTADAFVPRGFSATHVNLTHRNWTAVGLPDVDRHPIVDPRGLVTPLFDGWSVDGWIVPDRGEPLLPSRAVEVSQRLLLDPGPAVETRTSESAVSLEARADVARQDGLPVCRIRMRGWSRGPGWLVLALRPANPEGVSFVHALEWSGEDGRLRVNDEADVLLDRSPHRVHMSEYRAGDVLHALRPGTAGLESTPGPVRGDARGRIHCEVGLATAALLFRMEPGDGSCAAEVEARVPLAEGSTSEPGAPVVRDPDPAEDWSGALEGGCRLRIPDPRMRFLFEAAKRSLVLHSPGDVYPGPYTYKRFWFRDAAFILDALLAMGFEERVRRVLERFPDRQDRSGYFRSQEGEWDSNGAALWILDRYRRCSGERLPDDLVAAAADGARWIRKKRLDPSLPEPHAGLLPAGFSAEHLGPNDFYYWDDFWAAAGLRAAARTLRDHGVAREAEGRAGEAQEHTRDAGEYEREAADLLEAVDRSLERTSANRDGPGVPASPYRRMDAGAVGSLAAGYPLRLWQPRDPRLLATAEYLLGECTVRGGFFQEVIHSGINPYLTLHLARVLMRAGDLRFRNLVRTVAELASPTGQWPEAVHPRTGGGCMGDGQHLWAASEWALWVRSAFVREEEETLVLASGLLDEWLDGSSILELGPTPTPHGPVAVTVEPEPRGVVVSWEGSWRDDPPAVEVRLPGAEPRKVSAEVGSVRIPATGALTGSGRDLP